MKVYICQICGYEGRADDFNCRYDGITLTIYCPKCNKSDVEEIDKCDGCSYKYPKYILNNKFCNECTKNKKNKYMSTTEKIVRAMQKDVNKKVIKQLKKLIPKFTLAKYLIQIIERYGLFTGVATYGYDNHIFIARYYYPDKNHKFTKKYAYSCSTSQHNKAEFSCYRQYDKWWMRLDEGCHYVYLVFNVCNGNLVKVFPDSRKKLQNYFWKGNTAKERKEEIYNLLYITKGDKDEKC